MSGNSEEQYPNVNNNVFFVRDAQSLESSSENEDDNNESGSEFENYIISSSSENDHNDSATESENDILNSPPLSVSGSGSVGETTSDEESSENSSTSDEESSDDYLTESNITRTGPYGREDTDFEECKGIVIGMYNRFENSRSDHRRSGKFYFQVECVKNIEPFNRLQSNDVLKNMGSVKEEKYETSVTCNIILKKEEEVVFFRELRKNISVVLNNYFRCTDDQKALKLKDVKPKIHYLKIRVERCLNCCFRYDFSTSPYEFRLKLNSCKEEYTWIEISVHDNAREWAVFVEINVRRDFHVNIFNDMTRILLSCVHSKRKSQDVYDDVKIKIAYYEKKTEQKKELMLALAMGLNKRLGGSSTRFLPDLVT
jgi:hypothetical protein